MDPFDTALFEPPADTGEDEKKPADPFDIFGDDDNNDIFRTKPNSAAKSGLSKTSTGAAKESGDLFNFDDDGDGDGIAGFMAAGKAISSGGSAHAQDLDDLFGPPLTSSSTVVAVGGGGSGTSLFDDLLDFAPSSAPIPETSTEAPSLLDLDDPHVSQNETLTSKPTASNPDWLFGGDDHTVDSVDASPSKSNPQTTSKPEDQIQRLEHSGINENASGSNPKPIDIPKAEKSEVEPAKPLNVLVTAPSMDTDMDMDKDIVSGGGSAEKSDGEKEERKKSEGDEEKGLPRSLKTSVSSDVSDKVDSRHSSTSDFDMDFSVLELPTTAHLNFDTSNHKRTLSKKGSLSLRKRPTRAAIHTSKLATSEDSIFIDSTEPRPPKSPITDEKEAEEDEQPARKREAEVPREESPSRPAKKVAGGMKIPGLLEGLMGSKRFNKKETKQAEETSSLGQQAPSSTHSTSAKTLPFSKPSSETTDTKPSPPAPVPRSKLMALPRVLPTLPSKPLKSVGNESTKKSSDTESSATPGFLSKKPVLKSSTTPEKTLPSTLSSVVKKDPEPTTSPGMTSGKDMKPSTASTLAKDNKTSPSLTRSRVLPSIGGADTKKPLAVAGQEKPDMRKKPPTVMKKPALKSRTDSPDGVEKIPRSKDIKPGAEKLSDLKDTKPGSVFNKPSEESKLKDKISAFAKPASEAKPTPEIKPDGSEKTPDSVDIKPRSVFNKQTEESKLKDKISAFSKSSAETKPITETKPVAEIKASTEIEPASITKPVKPAEDAKPTSDVQDRLDGKEKLPDNKISAKPTEDQALEETFVIVDKSDCNEEESKPDLTESKSTDSTAVNSPVKETDEKKTISEKSLSEEPSKEGKTSVSNKPALSNPKTPPVGLTQPSPFSSSTKPSFLAKPNITKPKPDTPTKPTSSTLPPRKSSISSVKPPSFSDKSSPKPSGSPAGNMGRRDSITGSAYNPIGFKSALGSSDSGSESRPRGSSVSSDIKSRRDSVSSVGSEKVSDLTSTGSKTKELSDSSAGADDKQEVIMRKKPDNTETKPSWLTEANKNSLNRTKRPEVTEKTKEAADEANKIIKDQGNLRKTSLTSKPSTPTSTKNESVSEDNKSSTPWGVRLRKVDSSRPKSVVEPTNNENSSPGQHNWRQQMSQKRQSFVPPKELEKPNQQDSTPEWAKASSQRRQRLLEAGVINSDAK